MQNVSNAKNSVEDALTKPPSAESKRQHSRGLIRGSVLIGLGLVILILFGIVTGLVVFLNPLSLDLPITQEVQRLEFGPADWVLQAVSAPGFAPFSFIFPAVIIALVALIRR